MAKKHILLVTSTFPANSTDPVPSFIKDQIIAMKVLNPELEFTVLAPHDKRSDTRSFSKHKYYNECRFHYMWPRNLEKLTGQGGIVPSLKKHPWLYAVIPFFIMTQFFMVIRLTIKQKSDIINAHWIIPQGFVCVLAGLITRKKVIATVHGGDVFNFDNIALNVIKRFVLKRADEVVVNSSATKKRSTEIYSGREYQVIPMGVNIGAFNNSKAPKRISNIINILFVGRLSEEKGVGYLIEALASLKHKDNKFKAIIIGSGPEEEKLKQLAESLGLNQKDIEFTGWIDRKNIASYYAWADVFVGPSIESSAGCKEALGVVFLEASAASLPIIATRIGGIVDIIINGETGFLINQRSASEISEKIIELQNSKLRKRLGMNAQSYVNKNFSWQSVAERYNKLLETI